MEICRVKEEGAFKSGLLLFRSDPMTLATKADFAHRSIQEFLSALHCVDFWVMDSAINNMTGWPKEIWPIEGISEMKVEMLVVKMIPFGDSQFCRFYFGLLSGQPEFKVKIRKSLEEYVDVNFIIPHFLFCLSNSLADCSDPECSLVGEIVNCLVGKSFNTTKSSLTGVQVRKNDIFGWTEEKTIDYWLQPASSVLRLQLQTGLKLKWLGNSTESFYLRSESQTELKLIYIPLSEENSFKKIGELQRLEEVEWLRVWQPGSSDFDKLRFALEVIKLLPKCRNCAINDGSAEYFLIRLWLARKSVSKAGKNEVPVNSGHSGVNPDFIQFRVERSLGDKIFRTLSSLNKAASSEVEIESIERPFENKGRLRLSVSSNWSVWDFLRNEANWGRP